MESPAECGVVKSLPDAQLADQRTVPADVAGTQIVEQAAALANQHQQAAARVEVLRVDLEVLGQLLDALGEQCDLHFGRTGVAIARLELLDDFGLDLLRVEM